MCIRDRVERVKGENERKRETDIGRGKEGKKKLKYIIQNINKAFIRIFTILKISVIDARFHIQKQNTGIVITIRK